MTVWEERFERQYGFWQGRWDRAVAARSRLRPSASRSTMRAGVRRYQPGLEDSTSLTSLARGARAVQVHRVEQDLECAVGLGPALRTEPDQHHPTGPIPDVQQCRPVRDVGLTVEPSAL